MTKAVRIKVPPSRSLDMAENGTPIGLLVSMGAREQAKEIKNASTVAFYRRLRGRKRRKKLEDTAGGRDLVIGK